MIADERTSLARRLLRRAVMSAGPAAAVALAFSPTAASAHTDTDLVAVPAGSSAAVALKPTHGCSGSPTVEIAIRAPVDSAVAEDVDGWTATSEADGQGNAVLRWSGGSLPADQTGSFPVTFTVPDAVGQLLTFPSVQTCENGEQLAWIDGDPNGGFPAPRLLILDPGAQPASILEEVSSHALGREQLTDIVDIDAGANATAAPTTAPQTTALSAATTVAAPAPTSLATQASATTQPAVEAAGTTASASTEQHSTGSGGTGAGTYVAGAVGGLGVVAAAIAVVRKRRGSD